jgi:Xaa-Pro dipeptidase
MAQPLPFPDSEYLARIARAQALMHAHRLDALLLTAPPNFGYFTGFETTFWESPTRPWFMLVPRQGLCAMVVPEICGATLVRPWIGAIRTWPAPRPEDDGVSLLAGAIEGLGRRFGRIGMELGRESVVRMPVLDLFALRDRLRGVELVDGSPCIWALRAIKSPAEVQCVRRSCQVVSRAFEALLPAVARGRTQKEVARDLAIDILRRGADRVPFLTCASGPGGYPGIISPPSDQELADGDLLFLDVGATTGGYFCDFDRNYALGRMPDAALRAQDAVWRATEAGIAQAVPGRRPCDIWRAMMDVLEPAGLSGGHGGRMGHGLGRQLTEPPSNMPGDETVLEAGMVLAIEPGLEYAPGRMIVHEENVHITPDGPELLTERAPRELWTV